MEENKEIKKEYLSLNRASKLCKYSQDYLSLRARQGKLKAIKRGSRWVTTDEWLKDYIREIETTGTIQAPPTTKDDFEKVYPKPEEVRLEPEIKIRTGWETFLTLGSVLLAGVTATLLALGPMGLKTSPAGILSIFSSFTQNAESVLGDTYLKVAQFLLPGYSLLEEGPDLTPHPLTEIATDLPPAEPSPSPSPSAPTTPTTREITQVTQTTSEKVTEVTRVIETTEAADLATIYAQIDAANNRITLLSSQIQSKVDYTVPSYAPTYIPSSGLQVAGNALLTTLNVSGSGAIGGSLDVRQNFSVGNTKDNITPTMTVNADSTFNNPATFNSVVTIGSNLTIANGGDLGVSGDATITGNGTISGNLTVSGNEVLGGTLDVVSTSTLATSTIAQLTITNDLLISGNATTTQSQAFLSTILQIASSTNPIFKINASSTDTHLDFKLTGAGPLFKIANNQDDYKFYINNSGNVGVGTSNPNQLLHLRGDAAVSGLQGMIIESIDQRTWEIGAKGSTDEGALTFKDITANRQRLDIQNGGHIIIHDGNLGIGTSSPLARLTVQASSTKPVLNIASSTGASILYINSAGYLGLSTTSPSQLFSVAGNGYITGGLGIGITTTTAGVLQTTGDIWTSGNLHVAGNATVIGSTLSDTLTINSTINSNLIPDENATRDFGSAAYYWDDLYVDAVYANNLSVASTSISGTHRSTISQI